MSQPAPQRPRCRTCAMFKPLVRERIPSGWGSCLILSALVCTHEQLAASPDGVQIPDTFGCVCHEEKARIG